jgi:hypothetical protein
MKNFNLKRTLSYRRRLILLEKKLIALENKNDNSIFSNVSLAETVETAIQTEDALSQNSEESFTNEVNQGNIHVQKFPWFRYSFLASLVIAYYFFKNNPSLKKKIDKVRTEKEEIYKDSLKEDIWNDFTEWWTSIGISLGFYIIFYFFSKMTIDYFIKPRMGDWLEKYRYLTLSIAILYYGYLFVLDGDITASLKTPQQSLSIKLRKSKSLLSKVQEITEYFKENFKKFGILVNSAMIVDLLGVDKSYLFIGFGVPVLWAIRKFFSLYWELRRERTF